MRWRAPAEVDRRITQLLADARRNSSAGEIEEAWAGLGDAHVLSQPWPVPHVRVHAAMLALGWRTRDRSEIAGQLFRIAVAAPGSVTGRFPAGNSGRADVSAFAPAPVRDDLAELLDSVASTTRHQGKADR